MNVFGNSSKQLLQALTANAERETMDYVLQEMQAVLGEEMPEEDALRTYLQDPDKPTELSTTQQIIAMDKLLECAEADLRTLCGLIRCQQLKGAGVASSAEGFLRLVRPGAARDGTSKQYRCQENVGPRTAGRRFCAVRAFCRRQNLGAGGIHFRRAF